MLLDKVCAQSQRCLKYHNDIMNYVHVHDTNFFINAIT